MGRGYAKLQNWKKADRHPQARATKSSSSTRRAELTMGIKYFKPTSPARRYYSVSDFAEITTGRAGAQPPRAPDHAPAAATTTVASPARFRGGGHKQRYRIIDFRRDKIGVPGEGRVDRIRSEPHGAHRAAQLRRRREALHPRARRPQGRRQARREPQRRHQAGQQPPAARTSRSARRSTTSS